MYTLWLLECVSRYISNSSQTLLKTKCQMFQGGRPPSCIAQPWWPGHIAKQWPIFSDCVLNNKPYHDSLSLSLSLSLSTPLSQTITSYFLITLFTYDFIRNYFLPIQILDTAHFIDGSVRVIVGDSNKIIIIHNMYDVRPATLLPFLL